MSQLLTVFKQYKQTQLLNTKSKNGIQSALRMAYSSTLHEDAAVAERVWDKSKTQDEC